MPNAEAVCYRLPSISWDSLSVAHRRWLEGAVGTSVGSLAEFCECLFDRYFLLHNLGHVVVDVFRPGAVISPARAEHLANLFAVKYFQNKGDRQCLDQLDIVINRLLDRYRARFEFDFEAMDRLYPEYSKDLITLAAFQFNSFRRCLGDPRSLVDVVAEMAGREVELNPFVFPRKGTKGTPLANECAQLVFELNTDVPRVEVHYSADLDPVSLGRRV